ncbi:MULTISPECIES: hypothetical protein [Rhodobacterales]|jgi:hypothetical protein|uniref:hypothetical protein n=1 Tax=Rhodobacterales TaxID=204455 RepID=UPI00237F4859|nr:hypothetical protein [Phaeobacter gallaeciensis]MDE4138823.1 hypothetical protein [Phaeobacter gallaeciensis]MDE4148119.1 hypothetical protein [Phaeobacter gallaeciensis]MDE4152337.1 hypothetical protein [Phaeobacter gallaeciensis]MDE4226879.1 hypothetical protein [Phaeobacter gallaeciensis]MDE4256801.1 hypothetical protein [Phaeobacter gallaeciensis]
MRITVSCSAALPLSLSLLLLAGCGNLDFPDLRGQAASSTPAPTAAPVTGAPLDATGGALTVPDAVEEDMVSEAEAPAASSIFTGTEQVVASLGDPAVPGLWMETSLVGTEQQAVLRSASGAEVQVTLKPAANGGSARVSIAAMRALGLPLTELVELQVRPAN